LEVWDAEWALSATFLIDVYPSGGFPFESFSTHILDDGFNALEIHTIGCFVRSAFGQGATIWIELGVRS
jgi:hypothetical protein